MNPLIAQAVAQGHGPKVTDAATLHRIARLVHATTATPKQVAA